MSYNNGIPTVQTAASAGRGSFIPKRKNQVSSATDVMALQERIAALEKEVKQSNEQMKMHLNATEQLAQQLAVLQAEKDQHVSKIKSSSSRRRPIFQGSRSEARTLGVKYIPL